jgi:phosphoribosyl 1,2-cyclic phosphodiesterase
VQGLPFLAAADRPGSRLDIFGPGETGSTTKDLFTGFVRPPYFPVGIDELRGSYGLHDVLRGEFAVGSVEVMVRPVPHVGLTVGYRLTWGDQSIAYVSDHQAPEALDEIDDDVLELCHGVDLLIHDAQYIDDDWATKSHWGHCTVDYAVDVAIKAGVKALALFHHDPSRSDADLDRLAAAAKARGVNSGVEVFAAAEGMSIVPRLPIGPQMAKRYSAGPMFAGNADCA